MLSDGPKSFSPEIIKGAIEKLFPPSVEDTRVGDNLTEVDLRESRFDTSAIQILSDDQRKDFYEKIILKINTKSGNGLSTYSNMLLSWSYGGHECPNSEIAASEERRNSFLIPLINKLLNGELSEDNLSLLNASRMALVPKGTDKNGNCKGLRPICIGECIYRIAARWVAYCISPIIKEHLKKYQFAVGTRGGTEIIKHALQALYDFANHDDDEIILSLDITNGFGSPFRNDIFTELLNHSPSLCKLFVSSYGTPSDIFHSNGEFACKCKRGTKQGDPMSMIYFCMVMNRALEKIDKICQMDDSKIDEILSCTNIREMETMLESSLIEFILSDKPESKKPIAFADDSHITGSYKSILKRLPLIKMAFKSYGLLVNTNKSEILVTSKLSEEKMDDIIVLSEHHNILVDNISDEGCIIMGAPVGSDSYITDQLDLKISELSETIDRFCYLVDRTDFNNINPALTDQRVLHSQIAWAILSFCINAQGVYIVRMIRPDLSRQYAIKYDHLIDKAIACLVNCNDLSPISNALRDFGIKNGGLGMHNYSNGFDKTQYALSVVLSNNFLNKSPDHQFLLAKFNATHQKDFVSGFGFATNTAEIIEGHVKDDKGNEVKIFTRDFNRWFERIIHEGTFTDIFKSLLIDDSETKRKILELAFKGAYSKGICLMNDYSCEDATDNSLALRNDLLCTKMLKKQLILGCFEASFNKLIISTKNKDHDLDLWRNLVAMGCHIRNILEANSGQIFYWNGGYHGHITISNEFRHILRNRLSILENLSHADISPLCCQDNCKYKHTEHSYPYSLHLLASCHNAGIGANVKRHSDIKLAIGQWFSKCPRIRKVSYETLYGGCKGEPNVMNHPISGTLPKGYKKADICLELQDGSLKFIDLGITSQAISPRCTYLNSNFKNPLLNINYASTTWVRLEKEKNTYISNSIAMEKKGGSLSDPANGLSVKEKKDGSLSDPTKVGIFVGFSVNDPDPELDLNKVPKLHMFAMDYSGRINDDIDDGTTEGFLWRDRDPEVFFDSYSTRKWMCDIAGKDFNIKPLLAKVSKEVNICVGRILHKADVDAFNHKTSLYNYRNKNLQRATDIVQLPVV